MKTTIKVASILKLVILLSITQLHAQVAINTSGSDPDASAMLDIQSNNKGVLIPRMNSADRIAISNAAVGLLVFDITTKSFWFKDSPTTWKELVAGNQGLDEAYDKGGSGAGRSITADAGAVEIEGTDGFTVTGTKGSGNTIAQSGAGTRMFFNPNKAAFRAGGVAGSEWDNSNIGNYSSAIGRNTTAEGNNSFAGGLNSKAKGQSSLAFGDKASAEAQDSRAFGENAIASGLNSTAIGFNVQAFSAHEVVIGYNAETYTPGALPGLWDNDDRLFVVGNGLSVEPPNPIPLSTSPHNAFTILKRGNVGIGVSDPLSMLEVEGDVLFGRGNYKFAPVGNDRRTLMIAAKLEYDNNTNPKVKITSSNSTSSSYVTTNAVRNQEGDYTISFTNSPSPGFSEPPIVVATATPNSSGNTRIIALKEVTTTYFRVTIRNSNGNRADDSFNFIVIGENDDYFNN